MAEDFRITGAEQLRALGRDLKAAGEEGKGLRKELLAGLRVAGKPLVEKTRESARENLPHGGGLNEWIATSKIAVRNSLAGSRVGMRIVAKRAGGRKGSHDLEAFDRGEFRHPVYGRWLPGQPPQRITPGWFSKPLKESAPEVQVAALAAMEATARKIARG